MFRQLPAILNFEVLSFLSPHYLCQIKGINRAANNSMPDEFWRAKIARDFFSEVPVGCSPREMYKNLIQRLEVEAKSVSLYMGAVSVIGNQEIKPSFNATTQARLHRLFPSEAQREEYIQSMIHEVRRQKMCTLDDRFIESPAKLREIIHETLPEENKSISEIEQAVKRSFDVTFGKLLQKKIDSESKAETPDELETQYFYMNALVKCDAYLILRLLLNIDAKVTPPHLVINNNDLLYYACKFRRLNTINLLLEMKADVNKYTCEYRLRKHGITRMTPLSIVMHRFGYSSDHDLTKEIVKQLLLSGADPGKKVFKTFDESEFENESLLESRGIPLTARCRHMLENLQPDLSVEIRQKFSEIFNMVIYAEATKEYYRSRPFTPLILRTHPVTPERELRIHEEGQPVRVLRR